ncbi:MAG: hypothetical protein ACRDRW_17240 [Pseudonocardiaceae bacterium]
MPPGMEAALHLSTRTLAWLADHPPIRKFARSVWDEIRSQLPSFPRRQPLLRLPPRRP